MTYNPSSLKSADHSRPTFKSFTCGHCGHLVTGIRVSYYATDDRAWPRPRYKFTEWVICPECLSGSVFNENKLDPPQSYGPEIEGLPETVRAAYAEVRSCMRVGALTAAELVCRKIMMNAAVDKGAKQGQAFTDYVAFLESEGFTTRAMKNWVDLIRTHGNGATHEIPVPSKERAESTVQFTIQLLMNVYELPSKAAKFTS